MRAMQPMHALLAVITLFASVADATITVYYVPNQQALKATQMADAAQYTGAAAYNPTVLNPPPVPDPLPAMSFPIQLQTGGTPGASILQNAGFLGFSIEMSVANQVLGMNSSFLQVPFLNLMANLQKRSGRVNIRVGGNTQETASLVDHLDGGKILEKDLAGAASNPTQTPPLLYSPDLLYMMGNISSLLNIRWYLGIPFNESGNYRLAIASKGQEILGDYLIGLQAGNEPDLYARHQHRPETYSAFDYFGEIGDLIEMMNDDEAHTRTRNLLIGPNLAGDWAPETIWDTGFADVYGPNLAYLAVEHYPIDNCYAQFNIGTYHDPQETFPLFLDHNAGKNIVQPYLNSTAYAQSKNKPLLMFETNTASCGGFPGISDSFGAALWGTDYALQMAHSNFSGALMHIGGQNVFYNPFTPPPTNQSSFRQWTIGPIYYSALVMAEALGSSNKSQVLDLDANSADIHTPAYAIYEDGEPVRVALFNFITDSSGASDYTATIAVGGGETGQDNATPSKVKVKYLRADSVSQKGNFTWAGQTFGGHFESDGRLQGDEDIQTVDCDSSTNTCAIKVPAPGFALVFLTDDAFSESAGGGSPTTFSTSAFTKTVNTATVDSEVLATSNGRRHRKHILGSTSKGSMNGATAVSQALPRVAILGAMIVGALIVGRAIV